MTTAPTLVVGVDGCPSGWVAVYIDVSGPTPPRAALHRSFAEIIASPAAIIAVDMPIGLPDRVGRGGRGPESRVRPLLGARRSSVFSVPARSAVHAGAGLPEAAAYRAVCAEALATSEPPRRISKQCFHILPKIREIDALMTPDLAARVYEVHPEVAFWRLAGGTPMRLPKKVKGRPSPEGLAERRALLGRRGFTPEFLGMRLKGAGADDLIDAAVGAVIAARLHAGLAQPFPDPPDVDARGLSVAIWA